MEKLKKMAKTLDTVAKILMYGNMIGAALMLILGIVELGNISMNKSMLRESLVLNLGSVEVGLASKYAPSVQYINTRFFVGLMFGIGIFGFLIYASKIFRKILAPMKEGLPFDESVPKNLKVLGILTLVGGAIWSVVKVVIDTTCYTAYHISELFRLERITDIELSVTLDTKFLIVAAMIFLMSYIFQYGTELQKLSDETL